MEDNGLITAKSHFSFSETTARIDRLVKEKEFHIFATIDHSDSAHKHGHALKPTLLYIFGNPKTGGTGLMQEKPQIAIDLPAKLLVYVNHENETFVVANDFDWLARRHKLSGQNQEVIDKLKAAIAEIMGDATGN